MGVSMSWRPSNPKDGKCFASGSTMKVKNKIISDIHKNEFMKLDYNQKKSLPNDIITKAWDSIDWSLVIEDIKPLLHKRICNSIVSNMETEIKTDVKNILSIDGVRQRLRAEVYPKIIEILDNQ